MCGVRSIPIGQCQSEYGLGRQRSDVQAYGIAGVGQEEGVLHYPEAQGELHF